MSTAIPNNRIAATAVRDPSSERDGKRQPYGYRVGALSPGFRCPNFEECGAEYRSGHLAKNHARVCRFKTPAERQAWAVAGKWPERKRGAK